MQKKTAAALMLRRLIMCAFLCALSIVLGKYLAINLGEVLRLSFENLPIIFAGMAFGSFYGALTGVVADLVGCVLVGYAVNPAITIGAACIGFISGLYVFLRGEKREMHRFFAVLLTVTLAHAVGSVIVKTLGLAIYYDMNIILLMLWRLLNYTLVGAAEAFLIYYLMKNKKISTEIKKINGGTRK